MQEFKEVTSAAIPVALDQIDTDQIIPAAFLTSVSREGYGQNLFRGIRDREEDFVLNNPKYAGRSIMIVGNNFGCGSSREHAVWAITGFGIRAVIGKSFADIFSGNSANNGLLLVVLPEAVVDELLERATTDDSFSLTISLEREEVVLSDGTSYRFAYDQFRRHCLLHGLDDIDYINASQSPISEFRQRQASRRYGASLPK